jgi:hypothetical protein
MNPVRVMLLLLVGLSLTSVNALEPPHPQATTKPASSVIVFDILNFPARIDEPKLSRDGSDVKLNCAIANRDAEPLLGMRLVLMLIDNSGKAQRFTWSEQTEIAAYSIKTFALHPPIPADAPASAQTYLVIDEVIGSETIWRSVDIEKALRAFARGQHDVIPKIRVVANKYDRFEQLIIREDKE